MIYANDDIFSFTNSDSRLQLAVITIIASSDTISASNGIIIVRDYNHR